MASAYGIISWEVLSRCRKLLHVLRETVMAVLFTFKPRMRGLEPAHLGRMFTPWDLANAFVKWVNMLSCF
jgi:predicted component of type VI protein secretion system